MHNLGSIVNSDLSLLGNMTTEQVAEAVESAPAVQREAFYSKIRTQTRQLAGRSRGSRTEFEKRMSLLPKDIQAGLANQSLQATDVNYYSTKDISGAKSSRLFTDDDKKRIGYSNISSGKLEKGAYFLLYAIRLLYGTNTSAPQGKQDDPNYVNFSDMPEFLLNGEFEFKGNGTVLVPAQSCEAFNTETQSRLVTNTFVLDNPKLLRDQQPIELNVEWGVLAPVNSWMKVILLGTGVVKA